MRKKHRFFNETILFIGIVLFDYLFIALSITIPIGSATIVLGFIMNLFHGLVAGIYLSILSAFVASNHCGFVSEGQNKTIRIDSFIEQYGFTAREKEVLILILKGNPNSKIADSLFISESTVKFHVKNILKKRSVQIAKN